VVAGACRPLPLLKLRGLLTFGSPLDKIADFFRERVPDGHAVHAQLASFRHASRRRPSRRDDGPYPWPWTAHERYWGDPETYRALTDLLAAARR